MHKNRLTNAIALALAMSLANTLPAQVDETDSRPAEAESGAEEQSELEKVTVTGTNIRGIDLEGAQPLQVITRDDIEASGADNIIDILEDLTLTSGGEGTFTTRTAGALSTSSPVGSAGVSLRGLGTSSTLTLINGRRITVASFANRQESFVDINTIPLAAIDRVEILPSGASAIYGADAVAGVVNIILRNDYEGAEISVSYGDSDADTNDRKRSFNAIGGLRGDRGSATLILDYFDREPLFDRDRPETANEIRPRQQGIYPSFNDLFFMFNDQTEEPQDGGCPEDIFVPDGVFGEYCELNRSRFVATRDEFRSYSTTLLGDLELNDRWSWFNELSWVHVESRGTSSPAPFSRMPVDPSRTDWPPALVDDIVAEGGVDGIEDYYGFPIFAWGSFPDPRQVEVETDNARVLSGLRGMIGRFDFETAASFGRSESEQFGTAGLYKTLEFRQALLGNLCSDGSFGQRWDDVLARTPVFVGGPSCEDMGLETVFYDPFNGQANQDPRVDELIRTQAARRGESEMWAVDMRLSGDLFELPGNRWVKGAFGLEHRQEEVIDDPSDVARSTPDNLEPVVRFSFTEAEAKRRHNSGYAEFWVPVANDFELQLAGRFDDYDDFGSDFNPKVAFRWQPLADLVIRGSWSTSFRAPSLAQAGAGVTLSSFSVPCDELPQACGGDDSGAVVVNTELFGNPSLEPEEAENIGLGLLWQITPDADITVDYWSIDHENLVGFDEEDFIRRALAGQFPVIDLDSGGEFPPQETPAVIFEGGALIQANVPLQNFGFQKTDGIDASYTQYFDLTDLGSLRLSLDATWLNSFERQFSATSGVEELAGEFRYPELLADASLRWHRGNWRARLSAHYTSGYEDELEGLRQDTLDEYGLTPESDVDVASWTTFDLNLSYDFTPDSWLSLHVDNLFDRDPPFTFGSAIGVDLINHDTMGRFYTLRYNHRFQ